MIDIPFLLQEGAGIRVGGGEAGVGWVYDDRPLLLTDRVVVLEAGPAEHTDFDVVSLRARARNSVVRPNPGRELVAAPVQIDRVRHHHDSSTLLSVTWSCSRFFELLLH